jgi:hypothetical protein
MSDEPIQRPDESEHPEYECDQFVYIDDDGYLAFPRDEYNQGHDPCAPHPPDDNLGGLVRFEGDTEGYSAKQLDDGTWQIFGYWINEIGELMNPPNPAGGQFTLQLYIDSDTWNELYLAHGYLWFPDDTKVVTRDGHFIRDLNYVEPKPTQELTPISADHPIIHSIDERIAWLSRQIIRCNERVRYLGQLVSNEDDDVKWNILKSHGISKPDSSTNNFIEQRDNYQSELGRLIEYKRLWIETN